MDENVSDSDTEVEGTARASESHVSSSDGMETATSYSQVDSEISSYSQPISDFDVELENDSEAEDETETTRETVQVLPAVLKKPKPKHKWFVVPEITNRQLGTSSKKRYPDLFQRRCYGSLHCVQRLELMYKLEKHDGCVNSLNFHPNGELLASGSDDLSVVIWDWKNGVDLLSFPTEHEGNIFQSKFLPLTGDLHIVTCARDGKVRLSQVSSKEGLRGSTELGSHKGACHKLAVLYDQPQIVISVGEDSLILRHDLRRSKQQRITDVVNDENRQVALYSVSSNPLNSNEICVAGVDYRVRTYDLRKANHELNSYHPFKKLKKKSASLNVTCAVYNYNGSEILASYNDEDIYLFDVNGPPGSFAHKYQGHCNGATIKGVNFFGPKSEFVVSGSDCGYVYFWERESEAIVQWLLADDNGVVNCLEPHPQIPFICTSGLDPDVKVWVPSHETDPEMAGLESTVVSNLKSRLNPSPFGSDWESSQIMYLLFRHWNNSHDEFRFSRFQRNLFHMAMGTSPGINLVNFNGSSNSGSSTSSGDSDDDANNEDGADGPGSCATS